MRAVAPANWSEELRRLTDAALRRIPAEPRFVYDAPRPDPALPGRLDGLAEELESRGAEAPTRATQTALAPQPAALAAQARGLALDLRLALAVGTPAFLPLARQRFASTAAEDEEAARWAALPAPSPEEETTRSDDERDPRSLLSQLRAEVSARRIPVRVLPRAGLASLAAFGGGVLLVATDRRVGVRAARRTALHEVVGHALPWWQRGGAPPGGPREQDQEEGRALRVEEQAGLLDEGRRKELGLRHVAARMAHEGEGFSRIVACMEDLGSDATTGALIGARALRGGGLGRERVYLPWYWREGGAM